MENGVGGKRPATDANVRHVRVVGRWNPLPLAALRLRAQPGSVVFAARVAYSAGVWVFEGGVGDVVGATSGGVCRVSGGSAPVVGDVEVGGE